MEPASRIQHEIESIYRLYAALVRDLTSETGLGGSLIYAGEIGEPAAHLLRAVNIAGAAALASSADAPALRRAMREGALDFVVTDLDEALRILKNEIRRKQPVAVGVSQSAETIAREMAARGVQPDFLPSFLQPCPALDTFLSHGARKIEPQPLPPNLNIFPIPPDWKQPAAAFDALLLDSLSAADHLNRRWVRFAPRYLPTAARRLRSIACDPVLIAHLRGALN